MTHAEVLYGRLVQAQLRLLRGRLRHKGPREYLPVIDGVGRRWRQWALARIICEKIPKSR